MFRSAIRLLSFAMAILAVAIGIVNAFGWSTGEPMQLVPPRLVHPVEKPYPAPPFRGISAWFNTEKPIPLGKKVVLVDFWTYSCVNCLRTLPYLKAWDARYRDKGLTIVGVHSPEFAFEKESGNVRRAIAQLGLKYPVALDSGMQTWQAYDNLYWPAHYLIDQKGLVVYTHFGEGQYEETEKNIQALLGLSGQPLVSRTVGKSSGLSNVFQTPETYLGYLRADRFLNGAEGPRFHRDQPFSYQFPLTLPLHAWGLKGKWTVSPEKVTSAEAGTALRLHFYAKQVFLVLGTKSGEPQNGVRLYLDGKPIALKSVNEQISSAQVFSGNELTVGSHQLYTVLNLPHTTDGILEIQAQKSGLEAYAFTFEG